MHSSSNRETGLALVTVLFIFVLVSMLAIGMQQRQSMDIAQASATFNQTRAQLLLLSAEDIAKAGLAFDGDRDSKNNEQWDTASELWNQPFPLELKEEGAKVFVNVRDLQGLFNLNWLSPNASNSATATERLQSLLSELGLDPSIANNVKNWLTPQHSANFEYQNMEPAYRASEQPFIHPSELKLVKGVDQATYDKLEPYITALPVDTSLNINTAPAEVLASWDSALSLSDSNTVLSKIHSGKCGQDRNTALFKTVDELWQDTTISPLVSKQGQTSWDKGDFTVKSQYFSVLIQIELEGQFFVSEAIIRRDLDPNNAFNGVIYRDFSRVPNDMTRLKIVNC